MRIEFLNFCGKWYVAFPNESIGRTAYSCAAIHRNKNMAILLALWYQIVWLWTRPDGCYSLQDEEYDHDYQYDSLIGWPVCIHCDKEAPLDYYIDDGFDY